MVRAQGTNCDAELCRAFRLAGAEPVLVHLDALAGDASILDSADLIGFPGGFSFGDDVASGRIFAMHLRERVYPQLRAAVARGVLVAGVCNGFQVLVQVGLLPGPGAGEPWPEAPPTPTTALVDNAGGRFIDRWVRVRAEPGTRCVWTRWLGAFADRPESMMLPIAHGEGRFVAASAEALAALERGGQVAVRYAEPVNGSQGDIAGICDASGRVFGLMPHPERYLDWTRHPFWTRLDAGTRSGRTPGLAMFEAAVAEARGTGAGRRRLAGV